MHKFNTYIKEVPLNFLSFYKKSTKKEEVAKHLKELYGETNFSNADVECVLKRIINLARNATNCREDYEETLLQAEFKNKQWDIIKRCEICGIKFNNQYETSLEHVLPLSLGGDDNETNWQLLCKRCNHDKDSFFGIANVDRISIHTHAKIYSFSSLEEQINNVPKNYRYQVMEKNNRKCCECDNTHTNAELFVTVKNYKEIVTYDNLYTLCEECIKKKRIEKIHILKCEECEKMRMINIKHKRKRIINER